MMFKTKDRLEATLPGATVVACHGHPLLVRNYVMDGLTRCYMARKAAKRMKEQRGGRKESDYFDDRTILFRDQGGGISTASLYGMKDMRDQEEELLDEVVWEIGRAMLGVFGSNAVGGDPYKSPRERELLEEVRKLRAENGRLKSDITTMIQIGREATR